MALSTQQQDDSEPSAARTSRAKMLKKTSSRPDVTSSHDQEDVTDDVFGRLFMAQNLGAKGPGATKEFDSKDLGGGEKTDREKVASLFPDYDDIDRGKVASLFPDYDAVPAAKAASPTGGEGSAATAKAAGAPTGGEGLPPDLPTRRTSARGSFGGGIPVRGKKFGAL